MRIAVVCATYVQGKSYQENIWAEQLAKSGHLVRAFSAGTTTEPVQRAEYFGHAYETHAIRSRLAARSTFRSSDLIVAVSDFRPDVIVVCGDKTFAVPLCDAPALKSAAMISTYSENLGMHEFDWRKRGISLKQRVWALGFKHFRGGPIRTVCRRSTLIVGNTPQARDILARLFRKSEWEQINNRMIDMPLGFSPEHFYFDQKVRERVRAELGISEGDIAICMSSHFGPVKEPSITLIVSALGRVMRHSRAVRGVIVGFSQERGLAEVSARVSDHIQQMMHENGLDASQPFRFITHPFANRTRLFELYNAADIAVFNRPSISCQESLGTGLVGCFTDDGSLNHLVTMEGQGVFFTPGDVDSLASKLTFAVQRFEKLDTASRLAFRTRLAQASRWLGYDRIIEQILAELAKHRMAVRP